MDAARATRDRELERVSKPCEHCGKYGAHVSNAVPLASELVPERM